MERILERDSKRPARTKARRRHRKTFFWIDAEGHLVVFSKRRKKLPVLYRRLDGSPVRKSPTRQYK